MGESIEDGLSIPEKGDFESIAQTKALAFAEKSWTGKMDPKVALKALREYEGTPKITHGRIVKDGNGKVPGGNCSS